MVKYFHVSNGLRGCYMPDSSSVIKVSTRRELRSCVASQCDMVRDGFKFGGSQRAISSTVANAWRDPSPLDYVIPFGNRSDAMSYGVFISQATRQDYLEQGE